MNDEKLGPSLELLEKLKITVRKWVEKNKDIAELDIVVHSLNMLATLSIISAISDKNSRMNYANSVCDEMKSFIKHCNENNDKGNSLH